jgi:selenocysteine lyase/cysteine desulfurase
MRTRRAFVRDLAGAGAVAWAWLREDGLERVRAADRAAGPRPPEDLAGDEDFWRQIQQAFTVDRTLINLNNGGVSPSPRVVQDAMRRYLDLSNQAPVYTMWTLLDPGIETVRRRLAAGFGCDPEEIAVTRNASEAMETCILGLDLKPGDEVLTTDQDYPRMLTTWRQREKREGIVLRTIPFPPPPKDLAELADRIERAITPRTKVIMICHVTYLTGQIFPVKVICQVGRARGIEVLVDGAHGYAHFPFLHQDLDCDYYGTSLHKWLCAPHGTGFLYVRKTKIGNLWPLMAAPARLRDDIRKFEEIGTHPAANFNAVAEALTFHEGIGPARKAARLRYLRDRWARRLEGRPGVRFYTSLDPAQSCGLCTVGIDGVDPHRLKDHLWQKYRIIVAPMTHADVRGVRVTPHVYTTLGEVDTFSEALEKVIMKGI